MDFVDDRLHSTLLRVCEGAPDYVLDAKPMDKEAADGLPDALFADRVNRRYPVDSKASTWLSAAYFAKTAEDDNYSSKAMKALVEASIKLAADRYGIRKDVDEAMERLRARPVVKKASDDESNYGWPSEKKYPMFDERGVKLANAYFSENRYAYPPEMRKEIASRIFRKSAEYGIQPSEEVRVESGNGFSLMEDAGAEVLERVKAASHVDPEAASALAGAAKAMLALPPAQYRDGVEKMASIMGALDEELGFADQYGSRFRTPMEIFHSRNTKEAEDFLEDSVQLGGDMFSITKLAGLPMDLFTSVLGDGFGDMVMPGGMGGMGGMGMGHAKAVRITKKFPGGMMRVTISGGMPDMMDGGFGFDSDAPALPCPSECEMGEDGGKCPMEACEEAEDGENDSEDAENAENAEKGENDSENAEKGEKSEKIDVKRLGKALKALPEEDRNALRKAIELYMD